MKPLDSWSLDPWMTALARRLARKSSRRGFLGSLSAAVLGVAAVPLLPVGRGRADEPERGSAEGDPEACSYWRYCSIDGFLSSCCAGTHRSCPPGTEMSPITWLGTCRNPADGQEYVISYNDCCGKDICGNCFCRRSEREKPFYYTHKNNDIDWCMGTSSAIYNSTVAIVVGVSTEKA